MTSKVNFGKDYENLFKEVLNKVNKTTLTNFNKTRLHLNTNNNFYTPTPSLKKYDLQKEQHLRDKQQLDLIGQAANQEIKPLVQTRYYAFGFKSKTKSYDMGKTFVNLGNNRYQINRNKIQRLDRTEADQIQFSSMDHLDRNNFNINNVTFPLLSSTSRNKIQTKQISPQIKNNQFEKTNQLERLDKKFQITHKKVLHRRKNSRLTQSLQINNKIKSNHSDVFNFMNEQLQNVEGITLKPIVSVEQMQKTLKNKVNDYLKQVIFTKDTQKRLLQMERSIIIKRRLTKYKSQNKANLEEKQKQGINAWKHEITHQNPTDQIYDVFDHVKTKALF